MFCVSETFFYYFYFFCKAIQVLRVGSKNCLGTKYAAVQQELLFLFDQLLWSPLIFNEDHS